MLTTADLQTGTLTVLVVDDHGVFAEALTLALSALTPVRTVTTAASLAEARASWQHARADVVVLDVHLPDGSGLDLISQFASDDARVIVLTGHPRRAESDRAIAFGASAYLAKDGSFTALTDAVLHAKPDAPQRADRYPEDTLAAGTLTEREREVLLQLVDGADATRIASALCLSVLTVRSHIKSILSKLEVRSQIEAVALASGAGLSARAPQ